MKNKFILYRVFILFTLLLFSCKEMTKIDKTRLYEFFETNKIDDIIWSDAFNIVVYNSQTIKKAQAKMGKDWVSAEAQASVAAVLTSELLDNAPRTFDTIIVTIQDKHQESYSYSTKDLAEARKNIKTCNLFADEIVKSDLNSVKPLLGKELINIGNDSLKSVFKVYFPAKKIMKTELFAIKFGNNRASLYFDFYFGNNDGRSVAFTFFPGDNKIDGIKIL